VRRRPRSCGGYGLIARSESRRVGRRGSLTTEAADRGPRRPAADAPVAARSIDPGAGDPATRAADHRGSLPGVFDSWPYTVTAGAGVDDLADSLVVELGVGRSRPAGPV
jgi:hypothetical protein